MKSSILSGIVALAAASVACSSAPGSEPNSGTGAGGEVAPPTGAGALRPTQLPTSSTGEKLYSVTSVRLNGDQPPDVKVSYYTAEQMAARREAKASGGVQPDFVGTDSCSDPNAVDLWDSTQNGSCALPGSNEICFIGSGQTNLGDYCRILSGETCESTWAGNVRYFWPGNDGGSLEYSYCSVNPHRCYAWYQYFNAGQYCTAADQNGQAANFLNLN